MIGELNTLKAYRGTDPADGTPCVMIGLHHGETEKLIGCICYTDNAITRPFTEDPDAFQLMWALGSTRIGKPKPVAVEFLTRPDTHELWSVQIHTNYVDGPDERQDGDTLH